MSSQTDHQHMCDHVLRSDKLQQVSWKKLNIQQPFPWFFAQLFKSQLEFVRLQVENSTIKWIKVLWSDKPKLKLFGH